MNAKQVIDIFVEQGIVDAGQVDDIMQEVATSGRSITQVLVDFGFVTEEGFYQKIAEKLGVEFRDLKDFAPTPEVLKLMPAGLARLHGALPLEGSDGTITICLVDPLNLQVPEDIRFALGKELQLVVAPSYQIEDLIKKHYGADSASLDEILSQLGTSEGVSFGEEGQLDLKSVEAEANATPIIRYVDLILYQAIQDRASDIHFEPFENEFKIRYRVDGALSPAHS